MPHKTLVDGTSYGVSGRKICVNGTNFSVNNGKTLVDSTNKNINFAIVAPPWSSGDANAIMAILDAYHNGSSVDFSSWHIGDQRPITVDGSTYQLTLAHMTSRHRSWSVNATTGEQWDQWQVTQAAGVVWFGCI